MWNSDSLPDMNPKIGPPLYITDEMISKTISKMKTGKAAGPLRSLRHLKDPSFKYKACTNNTAISQDDPEVIMRNDKYEVVDPFRYLGNSIGELVNCF